MSARLNQLLGHLRKGALPEAEAAELRGLLLAEEPETSAGLLSQAFEVAQDTKPLDSKKADLIVDAILFSKTITPIRRLRSGWIRYAAAVLLICGAAAYLWLQQDKRSGAHSVTQSSSQIAPGREGATLTLADGRTLLLDSAGNGIIARENGTQLTLNNGQLSYHSSPGAGEQSFNTITTARGRHFQVMLPDGSQVWLNAGSSLRYPTAFTGSTRNVEIKGEAYFEVADKKAMPFRVKINEGSYIDVLATAFNINAYDDEATVNTTLVEGSVRVSTGGQAQIISPGQQAQMAGGRITIGKKTNIESVLAWKNGLFSFEGKDIKEVMRQLARWYDLQIVYEGQIPAREFGGEMARTEPLANVLRFLQESGVQFRMDEKERKLVVTN